MDTLRLGLPIGNKDCPIIEIFEKAGYRITVQDDSHVCIIDDPEIECLMLHVQEVAHYVERGLLDAAVARDDWILETDSDIVEVVALTYGNSAPTVGEWFIVVPEDSDIQSLEDLSGKRIGTELAQTTKRYLDRHGVLAEVEHFRETVEMNASIHIDAAVQFVGRSRSLQASRLRVIDTLTTATMKLIASHNAWSNMWKRQKIEALSILLNGTLEAESKTVLKLIVPEAKLNQVLATLPSIPRPIISSQDGLKSVTIEVIIDRHLSRTVIPKLKRAGAEIIFDHPLNRVFY